MKRFSSWLAGLAPWIFGIAALGFFTRFRTFGKSGTARDIRYLLIAGIVIAVYSLVVILHFNGVDITVLEYRIPKKLTLLNCFDASVWMIVILLLLKHVREIQGVGETVVMCMVSMAVSVLALLAERGSRTGFSGDEVSGSKWAGRLLLALAFLAVCVLSVLTFNTAFSGIEKVSGVITGGLKAAGGIIWTGIKFAGTYIVRFLAWLVSLMPEEEAAPLIPEAAPEIGGNMDQMPEITGSFAIPVWVWYILAAAAAVPLVIYIIRNVRIGGKAVRVDRNRRVKRRKAKSIGTFERLRAELCYRTGCIRYRRSVPGLLVYCEKHTPEGMARKKGESGESFLRRVSSRPEILKLSEMVEKQFYSAESITVSREEYRKIIRAWKTLPEPEQKTH